MIPRVSTLKWFFNLVIPRCSAREVTLVVPPLENPPIPPLQRGDGGISHSVFPLNTPQLAAGIIFFLSPQCGGGRGEGEGG